MPLMPPSSNSPSIPLPFEARAALSRRRSVRGNVHFDLCNLLEVLRQRDRLNAVSLSDAEGVLVAGAGSYRLCQELGARAACENTAAEIVAGGQRLLVSVERQNAEPSPPAEADRAEIGAACERILGQGPRKPQHGLLGAKRSR